MTKPKPKSEHKKTGRPSPYKPEYCDQLIKHLESGLSIESFAGVIGVHRSTLYEWAGVHPEFSDTLKRGAEISLLFWERMGLTGMAGKIQGFNAAVYIFNMKNRFKWRDSHAPDEARGEKDYERTLKSAIEELKREKQVSEKRK
jgi:hypothetical protein